MLSTTYFVTIFLLAIFITISIILIRNRNATPLKKAWNSYIGMSIVHGVLFLGMMLSLPLTFPSFLSTSNYETQIENLQDVQTELKRQRNEIEILRNQIDQMREIIWTFGFIMILFAPLIYYNLFKSNLEIEKLTDKRMGSFD